MRARIVTATVLLVIAFAAGCGTVTVPERVDSSTPGTTPEPQPEIFDVGDSVRMGKFLLTVNTVRWDKGTDFWKPAKGKRWLVVDVSLTNEASEATAVSSFMMFGLIDEEHYNCTPEFGAQTRGSVDGELGPGRTMRGELAWEVDEGGSTWELVFKPDVFGYGQAIFRITLEDFR